MNPFTESTVLVAPTRGSAASPHVRVSGSPAKESLLSWILASIPTWIVLALLGGLAYWGHETGWTVPKFEELLSISAASPSDWCPEHSVPESICVECNESLLPRQKSTWCRIHGVHNCPFERPEIVQTKSAVTIDPQDLERAQRALNLKERKENSSKCTLHHRRIQFASGEIVEKMGIDVAPVWRGPIVETVAASGEITFDQPRVAQVSLPVAGRVWATTEKGQLGSTVKKGDLLGLVDAVEVGRAKTEFLQAHAQMELRKKTVDMLKPLVSQGVIPEPRLLETEVALREARIRLTGAQQTLANLGLAISTDDVERADNGEWAKRLQFLGIPTEIASRLDPQSTTSNLVPVVATRDGVVTSVKVTQGEMADAGRPLFVLSDTTRMWLILNVRLEDVEFLRIRDEKTKTPGQRVLFRADGKKTDVVGELVWRSSEVDEKTRTVRYRAEVANLDGALLANTFGKGQIILREESHATVVPNEAVHWEGDCHLVFVRDKSYFDEDGKKVFHVRSVRPGVTNGASTEIIAGVLPGEVIATRNSASLRAELLKNHLGAG